jgi:excisionase family DNA binding protein
MRTIGRCRSRPGRRGCAPAVATYLGVTLRTVYAIIDEGQLPAFKIRRVIRVRREDVDQYLERSRIKPGELRHLYPATSEEDRMGPGRRSVP